MNYILTRPDFGHNTFYIVDEMENMQRRKSDAELDPNAEWVVRWGCLSNVPGKPKIINKAKAIKETVQKGLFRDKVAKIGHAPRTWLNFEDWSLDFDNTLPLVIRPLTHQRSEDIFFCTTEAEVKDTCRKLGAGGYYMSEFIDKTKEYRVFVAQGRALIVAEKKPKKKGRVSWGCVDDGGELDYQFWQDWNPALIQCAVESFNQSELDFAAIDIMEKDGKFYFLEANTAPEVWKYYGSTLAKVFTHIIKNDSRERIPAISFDNWKDCIHPALSPLAKVA